MSQTARVLRQRHWTEDELQKAGFHWFAPRKRLIMAQLVKVPTNIDASIETLLAEQGDIICYDPGDGTRLDEIDDYDHWPVQSELFRKTYRPWDEPEWRPNPAQEFLMLHRCRPYFKWQGVWALRLPISIYVQSLESPEPVVVPRGRWLCIGTEGEPYHMNDESLRARYLVPAEV